MTTTTNTTSNTNLLGGATMSNTSVFDQQREITMRRKDITQEQKVTIMSVIDKAEAMDAGELVIKNKKQLTPHLKSLMTMEYISAVNINLTERGPIVATKSLAKGRYTREALTVRCGVVPVSNGEMTLSEDYYAPFSKTFITVTFSDKCELDDIDKGVYIVHAGGKTRVFIPKRVIGGEIKFYENNGDIFNETEVKGIEGVRMYKILSFTASGIRNDGTSLFMDVTKKDVREEMLEDKSLGAYEKEKNNIEDAKTKLTPEKLTTKVVKDTQRFGQLQTGSKDLGVINCWARILGNFGRKNKFHDGMSFMLAEYFAEAVSAELTKLYGYKVTVLPDAVTGLVIQTRPGMVKALSIIIEKSMMSDLVKAFGTDNIEMYGGDKELDIPQFLTDDNGIKLVWDFDKPLNFELLRIGEASQAYTSLQMLTKPLYGSILGKIREKFRSAMNKIMKRQISEDFETAVTGKSILSPEEFNNGFEYDAMMYINSNEFLSNAAVKESKTKSFFRSEANACSKLKCRVSGANLVLTDDIAEMFGKRVLKYGEVYAPYYNREIMKATKEYNTTGKWSNELVKFDEANGYFYIELFAIKYPSVGLAETYVARAISIYEIAKRCIRQFKVKGGSVERYYRSLDAANLVVPASEELMKQLAGMDFDFDTATIVTEPELVELTKHLPREIVNIQ